jgi:hypothetical protein
MGLAQIIFCSRQCLLASCGHFAYSNYALCTQQAHITRFELANPFIRRDESTGTYLLRGKLTRDTYRCVAYQLERGVTFLSTL